MQKKEWIKMSCERKNGKKHCGNTVYVTLLTMEFDESILRVQHLTRPEHIQFPHSTNLQQINKFINGNENKAHRREILDR